MITHVSIPYLLDDGRNFCSVTLEGLVDTETTEVSGMRATDDARGVEVDIPEIAIDAARHDLLSEAHDLWRTP